MTTTFFLKQGETRTNSAPIPHPLIRPEYLQIQPKSDFPFVRNSDFVKAGHPELLLARERELL